MIKTKSQRRTLFKRGVPRGYRENWKYVGRWSEIKLRKGLWKFRFKATKRRKASGYGNFGKGTTGICAIRGKQYIRKTGKGEYQTTFVGIKKPIIFKVRSTRRRGL